MNQRPVQRRTGRFQRRPIAHMRNQSDRDAAAEARIPLPANLGNASLPRRTLISAEQNARSLGGTDIGMGRILKTNVPGLALAPINATAKPEPRSCQISYITVWFRWD
jgi:hypothetical protein